MSSASDFIDKALEVRALDPCLKTKKLRGIVGNLYKVTAGKGFCSERELAMGLVVLCGAGKMFTRRNLEDAILEMRGSRTARY